MCQTNSNKNQIHIQFCVCNAFTAPIESFFFTEEGRNCMFNISFIKQARVCFTAEETENEGSTCFCDT